MGDFSPKPGGRAGNPPLRVIVAGNTTGATSSGTIRTLSVSAAGIASAGLSGGSIVFSASSGTVKNLAALGNTTGQTSSTTETLTNMSVSGAGIVSVGYSTTAAGEGVLIVSATTAAQTVQTIGGLAAGNTTGSSSSTTFDARSVTVSGAGDISVGYSSNNILIISGTAPTASGTVRNVFASGNTTGLSSSTSETLSANSYSGAGIVSIGFTTSGAGAGMMIISATTAAQTVQTIGGLAAGNTTGSSSSTTFDARSVTVSGAGDISVGYSSNNILIISGTAPAASGTVVNMTMLGNTTGVASSSSQTLTALSFSGAGGISLGMSTTAAGSPVMVISGPAASGTVRNVFASGNTTGASSSSTETLSNISYSGAGIVSVGFTTSAAGAGMMVISATTAAQTVQTIGGLAAGNTTGSSSSTTFDARSVTVSGAGIVSVGYSSNNILIVSATTAAQTVQTIGGLAAGNTTGSSSSTTFDARSLTVSGAGGVSVGYSSNNILIVSGPAASGTVRNVFASGNTTGVSTSTTETLSNVSYSGAGIVSVGFTTSGAGAGMMVISATTAAQTVQSIGGLAAGNTTGSSSSTTFDARSVTVSGAGIVSVGYSSNNILIVSATTAASQGGLSFNAVGNTIGLTSSSASSIPETLTLSGAGGVSLGFSNSTIVISAPASSTINNLFALGNTTGQSSSTTVTLTNLSFSGAGGASIGYSTTGVGAGVVIVSVPTGVATTTGGVTLAGNTSVTSSFIQTFTSQLISGAGGITVGFSSSSLIISQNNTSSFFALGNTSFAGTTTSMAAANSLSFSGMNDIDVAFNAGTLVIANEIISYYEPIPMFGSTPGATAPATGTMPIGTMQVQPLIIDNGISFNQVRMLVSRATVAASLTQNTAAAASATATASAGWNSTVSLVIYSRQGGTSSQSFTVFGSTSMSLGVTHSWSISRTAASNTVTMTQSFVWPQGTSAALTSTFTTTGSAATTSLYALNNTNNSLFSSWMRMDVPFLSSLANGAYIIGLLGSSATATATGNSLNTAAAANWSGVTAVVTHATIVINNPGAAASNFFPGVGSTSSAGSVFPTTIGWQNLSSAANFSYARVYMQFGQL